MALFVVVVVVDQVRPEFPLKAMARAKVTLIVSDPTSLKRMTPLNPSHVFSRLLHCVTLRNVTHTDEVKSHNNTHNLFHL